MPVGEGAHLVLPRLQHAADQRGRGGTRLDQDDAHSDYRLMTREQGEA